MRELGGPGAEAAHHALRMPEDRRGVGGLFARGRQVAGVLLTLAIVLPALGCVRIPRERMEIRRYSLDAPAIR